MDEREVNLMEVLKRILLSWRFILIWVLIGTVAGGATGAIKVRQALSQQNQVLQEVVEEIDGEVEAEEPVNPINMLVKSLVIGILLGGFVSCAWIGCKCLFAGTILCAQDVEAAFSAPVLGQVVEKKKSRRFLPGIDKWIMRFFRQKGCQFSKEESIRMLATRIRVQTKKKDIQHVYLTGSASGDAITQIKHALVEILKNQQVQVSYGNAPSCDPESLEQMDASDAVVFVEQVDVSRYEDMKDEARLCEQCQVPIMGYVVLQ